MLMQNFQSAADLGISEAQKEALIKTLVLLETGKLIYVNPTEGLMPRGGDFTGHFNMEWWNNKHECGTICCIGGTAEIIGDVKFSHCTNAALDDLFYCERSRIPLPTITIGQAARALLTE